jgi:two-component system, NarL family, nitrate/nitrite response regulator NarL
MMVARHAQPVTAISRADGSAAQTETYPAPIGVVLVGGESLYREGVKSLLNRHQLVVLGEYQAMDSLKSAEARALQPTVVLAVSPDAASVGETDWRNRFRNTWPLAQLLVLAHPGDDRLLADCLLAGADGCLFTDMSADALIQSIRLAALGENLFPTRVGQLLMQTGATCERPRLTPREKDILRGLLAGFSNKMIANDLGTTDMTVKAQLRHLLRKLGVANRTQAALWAREQGIAAELQN